MAAGMMRRKVKGWGRAGDAGLEACAGRVFDVRGLSRQSSTRQRASAGATGASPPAP